MVKLEDGVYALETPLRFSFDDEKVGILLGPHRGRIEGMIILALLTLCQRHNQWIGASVARILRLLVSVQAEKQQIQPHEISKLVYLQVSLGVEMASAARRELGVENPWLQSVEIAGIGRSDTILALVPGRFMVEGANFSAN